MSVAVSIFPIYDLVRRVAGPDADVTLLLPPGRSPAGFAPTAKDEADVGAARVVVWVGLGLDPWMGDLVQAKNAPKASVKVLKVGDRVPTLATTGKPYVDPASGGGTAVVDPHVWLDPQRATVMAKAIGEELARADARHADAYRRRADEVSDALDVLDKELEAKTRPWQAGALATPPDAGLVYFADRYHLRLVPAGPGALAPVDTLGGGAEADTYEKLMRHLAAELGKTLR
jgi:zinc transport system substrate-binding protein